MSLKVDVDFICLSITSACEQSKALCLKRLALNFTGLKQIRFRQSTSQPINQILKCVVVDSFHKMMSDTLKHMMTSYLCYCVIPQLITANKRRVCC